MADNGNKDILAEIAKQSKQTVDGITHLPGGREADVSKGPVTIDGITHDKGDNVEKKQHLNLKGISGDIKDYANKRFDEKAALDPNLNDRTNSKVPNDSMDRKLYYDPSFNPDTEKAGYEAKKQEIKNGLKPNPLEQLEKDSKSKFPKREGYAQLTDDVLKSAVQHVAENLRQNPDVSGATASTIQNGQGNNRGGNSIA